MARRRSEDPYIELLARRIGRGEFIEAQQPSGASFGQGSGEKDGEGGSSAALERAIARICLECRKPRCPGKCREYGRAKRALIARAREESKPAQKKSGRAAGTGRARKNSKKGGSKNDR